MTEVFGQRAPAVLVLGATGKSGSRVAHMLRQAGAEVRDGSRHATPAFDWDDASTWGEALQGIGSVYVSFQPDLAVPGAVETVGAFLAAANSAGVRRAVLLSGRGEPEAVQAEELLKASGMEWTVLRASWFLQNFSESFFAEGLQDGVLIAPSGMSPEPFVDLDDVAEIAASALLEDDHVGRLYELTGPEALSFAQVADGLAMATGRPVVLHELPLGEYLGQARAAGVPEDVVWLLDYLFSNVLDGRNARPANGVLEALGRPPRALRDFADAAVKHGAWKVRS